MLEARQGREIVLRVKSRIGLLFEVSKLLAEKGVSILAVSGIVTGEECTIRLVTDDGLRTKEALTERGYEPQEESAILIELPHKPGILKHISDNLTREDIDIYHIYATALDRNDNCLLVLHTADDEHAIPTLNRLPVAAWSEF